MPASCAFIMQAGKRGRTLHRLLEACFYACACMRCCAVRCAALCLRVSCGLRVGRAAHRDVLRAGVPRTVVVCRLSRGEKLQPHPTLPEPQGKGGVLAAKAVAHTRQKAVFYHRQLQLLPAPFHLVLLRHADACLQTQAAQHGAGGSRENAEWEAKNERQ